MGRKKKEEPEIYHSPFGSTVLPTPDYFEPSPYIIDPSYMDVTTLGDTERRYITTISPGTSVTYTGSTGESRTIYYPPKSWDINTTALSYEEMMKALGKEEELKVKIDKIQSPLKEEHIMACQNKEDLSQENILLTMSAVKGKLMFDIAPIHIKEITCSMTPQVKANLVAAGKRLRMYGKKTPIIPSFDEYGNRLPDQIEIGDNRGIIVNIVDPKEYGELYFELKAIEIPSSTYTIDRDKFYTGDFITSDFDIPF